MAKIDSLIVDQYRDKETGVMVKVYEYQATSDKNELEIREKTKKFIERVEKSYPNRFSFDRTKYHGPRSLVKVICNKHDREFKALAEMVRLSGSGCPLCAVERGEAICRESLAILGERLYGDQFDYSGVKFIGPQRFATIKCKDHGNFNVSPKYHVNTGHGCKRCAD